MEPSRFEVAIRARFPSDLSDALLSSLHHKEMLQPCPKCGQQTVVCCHADMGAGSPDHYDQFCHVCLDPQCDYAEHRTHTVSSAMVTNDDQLCLICGRDVFGNAL